MGCLEEPKLAILAHCGGVTKSDTSDSNDTSNTANSVDASKTSASVIRLSSYFFPLAERLPTCATLVFFKFKQALEE